MADATVLPLRIRPTRLGRLVVTFLRARTANTRTGSRGALEFTRVALLPLPTCVAYLRRRASTTLVSWRAFTHARTSITDERTDRCVLPFPVGSTRLGGLVAALLRARSARSRASSGTTNLRTRRTRLPLSQRIACLRRLAITLLRPRDAHSGTIVFGTYEGAICLADPTLARIAEPKRLVAAGSLSRDTLTLGRRAWNSTVEESGWVIAPRIVRPARRSRPHFAFAGVSERRTSNRI